jgi:hypothetical protein
LAVLDQQTGHLKPIASAVVADDQNLDLAFLPEALGRASSHFPLLPSGDLYVGSDVYTYGFYSPSGRVENVADGLFKGNVVSFRTPRYAIATLSYPVIEGMSGSAVLTYHNGVKLVGICFGSESQRILASEIVDMKDGEREYRETINRIVEFGLAYRSEVIADFVHVEVPDADFVVTAARGIDPELS